MSNHQRIYRKDYQPSNYLIKSVSITFRLDYSATRVVSKINFYRNTNASDNFNALRLDGENLKLLSVKVNDKPLNEQAYVVDEDSLTLINPKESFELETEVEINPSQNTSLEGLYQSKKYLCTQCEPNGFRKITYFLDRPDIMTTYSVRIIADKENFPILLSNGNKVDSGDLPNNHHYAIWEDPYKKPSYLFALVAGDFAKMTDTYLTKSNRSVNIEIYAQQNEIDKCKFALNSLKQAMKWDEDRFNLEYDLNTYMIVAVPDFNSGAMENKGLNIFNAKFIMADELTTTDKEFEVVQGVVGHEYFHNWTGNRVTCRDWFQLGLKEGLTVFRDQEFTSDLNSRTVKRINDVKLVRGIQFNEDSGPMSHPARPDDYIEMNNFFTTTVYNKSAEIVRMLHTILGETGFNQGMRLYFSRHDGQAVTFDELINAMADANNRDLTQFKRWYAQSGTPEIYIDEDYNDIDKVCTLKLKQHTPETRDQKEKHNLHIPIKMGLITAEGKNIAEQILELTQTEQTVTFENINSKPVVSLLRDFSAPVKLKHGYTEDELLHIIRFDNNAFNRWDAIQMLFTRKISTQSPADDKFFDTIKSVLYDKSVEAPFIAESIMMPTESMVAGTQSKINVDGIVSARDKLMQQLAEMLQEEWIDIYKSCKQTSSYSDSDEAGKRKLASVCLSYLMRCRDQSIGLLLAKDLFRNAKNMTEQLNALSALTLSENLHVTQDAINTFYEQWEFNDLVIDKWLSLQAGIKKNALDRVQKLEDHPAFDKKNPNKLFSLIGAFSVNFANFHQRDGSGYEFLANSIINIDQYNPQVAAKLVSHLTSFRKYDEHRQSLMKSSLERISQSNLSKNVDEIVSSSLA